MKYTEGSFKGQKNDNLYYQSWLLDGTPSAVLVIVHGMAEHCGRYTNIINHFVPGGFAVYGFDLCGHGRSDGMRGYVERFADYLSDLKAFMDIVRHKHADARIFIMGHSMGGTVATAYAVQHQGEFDGLIVSGMLLKVGSSLSPVHIALARILSRLSPRMGISVIDASTISRDEEVVAAYVNDPLVYRGKVRARLGGELIKTMRALPHQLSEITLPILIMHGTEDRLSEPHSSEMLYQGVASTDKTLNLYQGFYHEVFNEPGREQVLADMEAWLIAHI